jgi:predicted esterase
MSTNLKGIDVFARVGSADQSVPPWQMRKYARILKEAGCNITFSEIRGKEHWWWDTVQTNGTTNALLC